MSFIARQPNGLICRFSGVVDTVTHYNMTEEEYIEMCVEKAKEEAKEVLASHMRPFEDVVDSFLPNNMTEKAFKKLITKMSKPK